MFHSSKDGESYIIAFDVGTTISAHFMEIQGTTAVLLCALFLAVIAIMEILGSPLQAVALDGLALIAPLKLGILV